MGSGKGKYLRAAFVLKPYKSFIEFKNYDFFLINQIKKRIKFKLNIFLVVLLKSFKYLKVT